MPAPPDQTPLAIAFHLSGGGPDLDLILAIKPEDMDYAMPSRLSVQKTLGGAWLDDWGTDLKTVTLSGTTGWRGVGLLSGADMYFALKQTVFDEWHSRRQQVVAQGQDPDQVTLILTDTLNGETNLVVPRSFRLRRSKSRPLLYMYQIELLSLGDATDPDSLLDSITSAMSNPLRWLEGAAGLSDAVIEAQYYLIQAQNVFVAFSSGIATFVNTGIGLVNSIVALAQTAQGSFDVAQSAILNIGQNYALAGANAFSALAASQGLTPVEQEPLMQMASIWGGIACLISNSFNVVPLYPTYDALLGASFCSSTGGGDPPSAYSLSENPWADIVPVIQPPVSIQPEASQVMASLALGDPLLLVGSGPSISAQLATLGAGVNVT